MYYLLKTSGFIALLFFLCGFTSADQDWQVYFENDLVRIEMNTFRCTSLQNGTDNNYILLRISNKTHENIEVSYLKETWYDGVCSNCNSSSPEHANTLVLSPEEIKEGNCDSEQALRIFQNMPSGFTKRALTHFEIKNLAVKTLN